MPPKPIPTPLKIGFEKSRVELFRLLLNITPLPSASPLPPAAPWKLGIDLDYLKDALNKLRTEWSIDEFTKRLNMYPSFMVHWTDEEKATEGDLHFIHAKSKREDAIPLIMLHGWPGT